MYNGLKIMAFYPTYQGNDFLKASVDSIYNYCDKILFFHSHKSWIGQTDSIGNTCLPLMTEWQRVNDKQDKILNITGVWQEQLLHYTYAVEFIQRHYPDIDLIIVIDTDEIWDSFEIEKAIQYIKDDKLSHASYSCKMYTYIKSIYFRVGRVEPCSPVFALNPKLVKKVSGVRCNTIWTRKHFEDIKYHHMCYVRVDDEAIRRKFKSIQIADGTPSGKTWLEDVYYKINSKTIKHMVNLHPSRGAEKCWSNLVKINKSDLPFDLQKDPVLLNWDENSGDKVKK